MNPDAFALFELGVPLKIKLKVLTSALAIEELNRNANAIVKSILRIY
jgi:hypothetical protein